MAVGDNHSSLSLNTLLHLLIIKHSSCNYLLWRNRILPLLSFQKLTGHIDGTLTAPPRTITPTTSSVVVSLAPIPNSDFIKWQENDKKALLIVQSSLTEEAMAEVLCLPTTFDVRTTLENAYSQDFVERVQTLRDSLRQLKKGASFVAGFGQKFKCICNLLPSIFHPVDDYDKSHGFLCGLGSSFEDFSIS